MLVPLRKAVQLTGLSPNTLRKYADNGTILCKRVGTGKNRLYDVSSLIEFKESTGKEVEYEKEKPIVCYCRVSNSKQSDELARQVVYMRTQFPDTQIIQDIGSGLNFNRKGMQTILQRLLQGDKFTLIVAHRDRLCRFGFQLFDFLFKQNGGEIMVLNENQISSQQELREDLLTIIHTFSQKLYGLKKYETQIKEDKNISESEAETTV